MARYLVVGPNTFDGEESSWFPEDRKMADAFAKQLASDTNAEVKVYEYIGTFCPIVPVEWVPAESTPEPSEQPTED